MAFGNKTDNYGSTDILHITARDTFENILAVELLPQSDIVTKLNLAKDLDSIGQPVFVSELEYNFLERIGGSLDTHIFDSVGQIYDGEFFSYNGSLSKKIPNFMALDWLYFLKCYIFLHYLHY